jgi:membrane-anchored protein YejM (alkaline phosphatase superfamily)
VDRLTSHLDVPATLLALLGAKNPPDDYSLGEDLLAGPPHPYVLVSDWSRVAYVDGEGKATFPIEPQGWFKQVVSDRRDAPLADPGAWLRARSGAFARVLSDLARFTHGPEVSAGVPAS